jgi:hypothetical protein
MAGVAFLAVFVLDFRDLLNRPRGLADDRRS